MSTCFLFFQDFECKEFVSLKFGGLEDELSVKNRTVAQVLELQKNARTIVVLSAGLCGIYEVALPKINENKLRNTIPFALEENIAQDIELVHVCFDQKFYADNQYLTTIIDKPGFQEFVEKLKTLNIHFDIITIDYFALDKEEVVFTPTGLLINHNDFKGSLSEELTAKYLNSEHKNLLSFKENVLFKLESLSAKNINQQNISYYTWIAKRLLEKPVFNLCQGDFVIKTRKQKIIKWYKISGVLAFSICVCFIVFNATYYFNLNREIKKYDKNIERIYKKFFPEAINVVSPKFRIEHLLKQNADDNDSSLFMLLNLLGLALNNFTYTIEKIDFKDNTILVSLMFADFKTLEAVETELKYKNLKVNQRQALSQNEKVLATLEIKF